MYRTISFRNNVLVRWRCSPHRSAADMADGQEIGMSDGKPLDAARREILSLRARVVVLEKMVMAVLELALRIRPEELEENLELARSRLSADYEDLEFAAEITHASQREFLAREVERLMRGVQADLGLAGGVSTPERG
jgi:hypothetical protein